MGSTAVTVGPYSLMIVPAGFNTATAFGTNVALNDEAENHCWVSPDEAAKLDLNGPTRILLDYVRSHPHR